MTQLNANLDRLIESSDSVTNAAAELHRTNMVAAENHLFSLEVQGASTQLISENISKNNILIWNKVLDNLPQALFRFTRKEMLQVLPTNSNLAKWNRMTSSVCSLCCAPNQTNKHVLSNCSAALDRYTIRHNILSPSGFKELSQATAPCAWISMAQPLSNQSIKYFNPWLDRISFSTMLRKWLCWNLRYATNQTFWNPDHTKWTNTPISNLISISSFLVITFNCTQLKFQF